MFSLLEQRERLIVKLAVLDWHASWRDLWLDLGSTSDGTCGNTTAGLPRSGGYAQRQPTQFGKLLLPDGLLSEIEGWRKVSIDTQPEAWVFASEKLTPLSRDNCWRRHIGPKLKEAGLGWVNFSSHEANPFIVDEGSRTVDPKVVADQLGHTVDVNQNVYTNRLLGRRKKAVNSLEFAL